jgi:crossover junction endodeoxyribonuclease RuvC
MRILGVDPGSRKTGYGVIEIKEKKTVLLSHGTLKANQEDLCDRLFTLSEQLDEILCKFHPEVIAIERIFFAKNALSALTLGHIRGALIVTAKKRLCSIAEYTPTEVKSMILGYGRAEKKDIQSFLAQQFQIPHFDSLDASDGLALAICHSLVHNKSYLKKQPALKLSQAMAHKL